ncbi:NAD(P)/FAD-dependent oxidoreductase [Candidatus Persebacteraceae bacterium Df01]|jgi:sulfide dehydrogenase [flavocytochrome c] flavoprotein subunit|uniref:NAD(P)/FAD-dependent oxidoreductase n=1 Tax=Candidatus Doriopsillibacter californiensis TaxID=2970740 RepID=A0ABT7QKE3_9GAMM|nr:NAD(P)/FAD-dependent oxidoreductase [Candidatus Persebacteraceae bacterium Df01]
MKAIPKKRAASREEKQHNQVVNAHHSSRRAFCSGLLAATGAIAFPAIGGYNAKVTVIGGGFGGAIAAKQLKILNPNLAVTLIEQHKAYYTCPLSNLVLAGVVPVKTICHKYTTLSQHGVRVVHGRAQKTGNGSVILTDGSQVPYDRVLVAPGIDFYNNRLPGYSAKDTARIPHAWRAGEQTTILRRQLEAMPDGGVVIIMPPPPPYRCPPAPYERTGLIAHYLQLHKPACKILILDSKEGFSQQTLFTDGWENFYGDMIEWRSAEAGGLVEAIDINRMMVKTEFGEERGDVINYIPPQHAGEIAINSGLTDDSGWCPINTLTFESTQIAGVHVIGDAAHAGRMTKSGYSASAQGKAAAAAIVNLLQNNAPPTSNLDNICHSLVTPDYGISVTSAYRADGQTIVPIDKATSMSPRKASAEIRHQEARQARAWYDSITAEMFG